MEVSVIVIRVIAWIVKLLVRWISVEVISVSYSPAISVLILGPVEVTVRITVVVILFEACVQDLSTVRILSAVFLGFLDRFFDCGKGSCL